MLVDYEKKLATFVSRFLLACHSEGVIPDSEDGCDLSDPAYLLSHILELKPYYVGSLCIDESLFSPFLATGFLAAISYIWCRVWRVMGHFVHGGLAKMTLMPRLYTCTSFG